MTAVTKRSIAALRDTAEHDLTYRFPLIVEALARLQSPSCIIDGEAVVCDDSGLSNFNRLAIGTMTRACSCMPLT